VFKSKLICYNKLKSCFSWR